MNITFNLIAFLLLAPGSSPRLSYGPTVGQTSTSTSTSSHSSSSSSSSADTVGLHNTLPPPSITKQAKSPSELRKARASSLSIANFYLVPAPERILGFKSVTENVTVRNSTPGPFKDYEDYSKRALTKEPTAVRDYRMTGHKDVRIVLTEAYGKELDNKDSEDLDNIGQSETSDAIKHNLRRRVCPADIPQLLDAMPDSRYFKKVFISENLNPEDDYVTQTYYPEGFISSMAMTNGQLELYRAERNEFLRRDVLHEWSHQLRYEFWTDRLKTCFEDAVNLELVDWNPSIYATRGAGEQWAVLGERMLGFGGEPFLEACNKAPIRTTLWMRALQKCLSAVPEPNKSVDHDKYVARMQYVEKHVLPKAMKKLEGLQVTGKTEFLRDQAKGILQYLSSSDWKRLSQNLALVFCLESYARSFPQANEA